MRTNGRPQKEENDEIYLRDLIERAKSQIGYHRTKEIIRNEIPEITVRGVQKIFEKENLFNFNKEKKKNNTL